MFKRQLAFPGVFKSIFAIFHVFESQLVKTCPRRILAKTVAGRTKIELRQALARKIMFAIVWQMKWSTLHLEPEKNIEDEAKIP